MNTPRPVFPQKEKSLFPNSDLGLLFLVPLSLTKLFCIFLPLSGNRLKNSASALIVYLFKLLKFICLKHRLDIVFFSHWVSQPESYVRKTCLWMRESYVFLTVDPSQLKSLLLWSNSPKWKTSQQWYKKLFIKKEGESKQVRKINAPTFRNNMQPAWKKKQVLLSLIRVPLIKALQQLHNKAKMLRRIRITLYFLLCWHEGQS